MATPPEHHHIGHIEPIHLPPQPFTSALNRKTAQFGTLLFSALSHESCKLMKPLAWPNRKRLLRWDHAFTSSLAIFWIFKSQTIHDIFPSLLAVQTHNRGFNSCLKKNQPTNHQPTIRFFSALQTTHHRHHDIRFTHRPPYLHMHGTFRVHVL